MNAPPPARAVASGPLARLARAGELDFSDWNLLAQSIGERLLALAAEVPGTLRCDLGPVQAGLVECGQALAGLVGALTQWQGRHGRLERELRDVQAALATARVDLAGVQDIERHATHLARHDGLTALPNRRYFRERLDLALASSVAAPAPPSLAVMFVDLDGFKPINDQHGHAAGDALLRIVAERLARSIRTEDLVGRLGGDEFGCLLMDVISKERLGALAAGLFAAVAAPLQVGALELSVRPSIGIAICPADGATADTLLTRADAAMYHAKRHRLGYAFFGQ